MRRPLYSATITLITMLSACGYSSTLWQGADTVPAEYVQIGGAANIPLPIETHPNRYSPPLEVLARYGLCSDVDIGGKLSLSPGIEFGPKWRFTHIGIFSVAWLPTLKLYKTYEGMPFSTTDADPYVAVAALASPVIFGLRFGPLEFTVAPDIETGQLWQGVDAEKGYPETGSSAEPAGGFVSIGGRLGVGLHLGDWVTLRPECGGLAVVVSAGNDAADAVSSIGCGLAVVIGNSSEAR